ncbi:MAG: glycosyltransferase family 9 protein [Candidatus Rokuibacteriota bacterium]
MHVPSGLLFRAFDADRGLERAIHRGARRFATAWIRGLGDVAFIVAEFVRYVGARVPGADVTVLVRPGLKDAARWIEGVHRVVVVEEWTRPQTLSSWWGLAFPPPWEIRRALARRGLAAEIDAVLPYPLGRWYDRDPHLRRPRLRWTDAERRFGQEFIDRAFADPARFVVALNTHIGTSSYYDFDKEWGTARFAALIARLLETLPDSRLVLVDGSRNEGLPRDGRIMDARGALGVAESVSVIAAADLFIGLDAGPANLVYFLDGLALDLVVLLGRTSCFTPLRYPPASPGVRLWPLVGAGEDIQAITPEAVLAAVHAVYERRRDATRA